MINGIDRSVIFGIGACTCIISSLVLIFCNFYFKKRKEEKKLEAKGSFGFPVSKWKSYNNQVQEEISKLKKRIDNDETETKNDNLETAEAELLENIDEGCPPLEENDKWDDEDEKLFIDQSKLNTTTSESNKKQQVTFSEEALQQQDESDELPNLDPENLSGKLKTLKIRQAAKKLEADMTDEQKHEEAEVRRQQLARIFELMNEQKTKFGINSVDDVQEQMHLYSL